MTEIFNNLRHSLVLKLILAVGVTLLLSVYAWSYFTIQYQENTVMDNLAAEADRFSNTIILGTHYAMMLNSRDDIAQIIKNISRQQEIKNIRIYNKQGQIKYSNHGDELDQITNIRDEACFVCHQAEPPQSTLALTERTRIFRATEGYRLLGILSPIYNEPGCSASDCHFHPEGKKILGALDVVMTLEQTDRELFNYKRIIIALNLLVFVLTAAATFIIVFLFIRRPMRKLIEGTRRIAKGDYQTPVEVRQHDEMGLLAVAINRMGSEIGQKQTELNRQRDEYQNLFELVPCLITVQDRNYRLINYNREFCDRFDPEPGDYCYHAYKGRTEKCTDCPVEMTFRDGRSHHSEQTVCNKDDTLSHIMVITSPLRNAEGEIVSAMEISLDITERKMLETELEKSEIKYHAIFNNIPNSVFVLEPESLKIVDCNQSVTAMYGYEREEIVNQPFMSLYEDQNRKKHLINLMTLSVINQVKHKGKNGQTIFVSMRISPSEFHGNKVLLVTTSDITKRLEAEQQLHQASKMATLGEMATGVAHELNQPLSVIKTVSSFFIRKLTKQEKIDDSILATMLEKVDGNVDRATKIIKHMRLFARKSDVKLVRLQPNEVLERACEIFNQQLKARGIELVWDLEENLPVIMADPDRLEQVFINLIINARDAIEEDSEKKDDRKTEKQIAMRTWSSNSQVFVEVSDTGPGIPDQLKDKVFDPFFTTKEVGKGTGLGLSISYGIVKDCGGNIYVARGPERGATFVMEFPVAGES
jgi:histidine kinase